MVASGRRDGHREFSSSLGRCPLFCTSIKQSSFRCASTRPHCSRSLVLGEGASYQCSSDETVQLPLNAFLPRILGESIIVMSNNTTVMAYVKKQRGTVSWVICSPAQEIVVRTELHSVTLYTRYILGKNILVDQVSRLD